MLSARDYYGNYHGHLIEHLGIVARHLPRIQSTPRTSMVYLAGDSSFDNKFWILKQSEPAVNGYEAILSPPRSVPDIAHQLNKYFAERWSRVAGGGRRLVAPNGGGIAATAAASATSSSASVADGGGGDSSGPTHFCCVNGAVEESTVGLRDDDVLLPQDEFIRDHLTKDDVLVVSVGGNDIALRPTASTVCAMGWLSFFSSTESVRSGKAWGLWQLEALMGRDLQRYLDNLTSKTRPRLVIPCMLYYPDENPAAASWASPVLKLIGYNKNPSHVQAVIDRTFTAAVSQIRLPGTTVLPLQLSHAMNGKTTEDYVARVEPSAQGVAKIARLIGDAIARFFDDQAAAGEGGGSKPTGT